MGSRCSPPPASLTSRRCAADVGAFQRLRQRCEQLPRLKSNSVRLIRGAFDKPAEADSACPHLLRLQQPLFNFHHLGGRPGGLSTSSEPAKAGSAQLLSSSTTCRPLGIARHLGRSLDVDDAFGTHAQPAVTP
jgi:hypothetical protein